MATAPRSWRQQGEHWIWLNAMAISMCLIMVVGLIAFIAYKGLSYFWPSDIAHITMVEDARGNSRGDNHYIGKFVETEDAQTLYKIGNRQQYGLDFMWLDNADIAAIDYPRNIIAIERFEWGNAYGVLENFTYEGVEYAGDDQATLKTAFAAAQALLAERRAVQKTTIDRLNKSLDTLEKWRKKHEYHNTYTTAEKARYDEERAALDAAYAVAIADLETYNIQLREAGRMQVRLANTQVVEVPFEQAVHYLFPNQMNAAEKAVQYARAVWTFLSDDPREANTEGGIFPAIFGTIAMVMLMTVFVTPLGIVAAFFLREYAKQGVLVRFIRICVNNLAGVPSIVYGVFGLGFFVYVLGGSIDSLFYPHLQPAPTFGSPNLLWASLTLALLTLPVVIVSTEEGLSRIPISLREGSIALGATKFETIYRIILPIASPAIMTGLILAIARAAGEVAPLMLVGVVKLAPDLPIDGMAPFLHLDRQFMHLGFHIYDVGFQSPNVEAARPLVYATALLLLVVIVLLNLVAISVRNRLRERYKSVEV